MPSHQYQIRRCHSCEAEVDLHAQICPICGERGPETVDPANLFGSFSNQRSRSSISACDDSSKCCRGCNTIYDIDALVCPICGDPRFRPVRLSNPNDREPLSWSNKTRLKVRTSTGIREVVVPMPCSPAAGLQNQPPSHPPRASTAPPMPYPTPPTSTASTSTSPSGNNTSDKPTAAAAPRESRWMVDAMRSFTPSWPSAAGQRAPAATAGMWSPVTDWFASPAANVGLAGGPSSAGSNAVPPATPDYMLCARTTAPNLQGHFLRGPYPARGDDGGYTRVKSAAASAHASGGGGGSGGERRCTACGTMCGARGYVCPICGEPTAAFARVVVHAPSSVAAAYAVR